MFRHSNRARDLAEIERRMQFLERRLDRLGNVASRAAASGLASAAQATDRVGDAVISALGDLVDRFRGGARNVGGEAARFGHEASKLGNDALRRVTSEIRHRPLMTLAIAAGIGLLIGYAGRRS
jgi:ElaB/YqjD/DUF883 family membrane-anchored ribosome-binding protein